MKSSEKIMLKKTDKEIISIVSINATLIGIFTALYLAYTVNTIGKFEDLEFEAFKEAQKLNQTKYIQCTYIQNYDFNELPFGKKYHDIFVYVAHLLDSKIKKTYSVNWPIPEENSERAKKALSILMAITNSYPFFEDSGKKSTKLKFPNRILFSDFKALRDWDTEMEALFNGYNVIRMKFYLNTDSLDFLKELVEKERELIAAMEKFKPLTQSINKPRSILIAFIKNMNIAYDVWTKARFKIRIAEKYRKKMIPTSEIWIILFLSATAFSFGVIAPLIKLSTRECFLIYIPIIVYVIIFIYIFFIAFRVVS